jgi:hypothetical protein
VNRRRKHTKRLAALPECGGGFSKPGDVLQDEIAKTFKVTGTSNKTEGSENFFLWHRSNKESCQDDVTDGELKVL